MDSCTRIGSLMSWASLLWTITGLARSKDSAEFCHTMFSYYLTAIPDILEERGLHTTSLILRIFGMFISANFKSPEWHWC